MNHTDIVALTLPFRAELVALLPDDLVPVAWGVAPGYRVEWDVPGQRFSVPNLAVDLKFRHCDDDHAIRFPIRHGAAECLRQMRDIVDALAQKRAAEAAAETLVARQVAFLADMTEVCRKHGMRPYAEQPGYHEDDAYLTVREDFNLTDYFGVVDDRVEVYVMDDTALI